MAEKRFIPVIGIEVHAELKTKSKMFSSAPNNPHEIQPNKNIDPVTFALPGTLPVINKQAVHHMVRIGLALGGTIANFTEFDRKNYFYPDIPKGYQISQYKYPIVSGGTLAGVAVTRVHLEEDTGTSKHDQGDFTLLDYNRAGVPLMEMVTEPVIYDAETAGNFGRELQLLLRTLDASNAQMEKGEMRVEVNISVMETDKTFDELRTLYAENPTEYFSLLGTKVEVKNINSFKSVEKAVLFETERMANLIRAGRGDEIVQETRGWDENKQITVSQRKKESAHDYRYFPDPDLPKLYLHELFDLEKEKAELPELPWEKRLRYAQEYGISTEATEMFLQDKVFGEYFEQVARALDDKKLIMTASNYITSDFMGLQKENPEASLPRVESFITLMRMIGAGDVNSRGAKDLLAVLVVSDGDPQQIAEERGLIQKDDPELLRTLAQQIIDENPEQVAQYKQGNEKVIKYLMGQVMKLSGGSAHPQKTESVLQELLS